MNHLHRNISSVVAKKYYLIHSYAPVLDVLYLSLNSSPLNNCTMRNFANNTCLANVSVIFGGFFLLGIHNSCKLVKGESDGLSVLPIRYTISVRGVFGNDEGSSDLSRLLAESSQVNVTLRLKVVAENITELEFSSTPMLEYGTEVETKLKFFVTRANSDQILGRRPSSRKVNINTY